MNSKESLKSICENFLSSPTPSWEAKYRFVFSFAFHEAVEKVLGKLPDYYDPNSSYEEDVRAYLNAILKEMENTND
jgi:hypothetical protein